MDMELKEETVRCGVEGAGMRGEGRRCGNLEVRWYRGIADLTSFGLSYTR